MASAPPEVDPFPRVREYVASTWPGRPPQWLDDVTGEALKRALEADNTLRGAALVAAARRASKAAALDSYNDDRRGHRVARTEPEAGACETPKPRRRPRTRAPRTPKGLTPIRFQQPHADYVRNGVGDFPTEETRLMAYRMVYETLLPIVRGEPISPAIRDGVEKTYREVFGGPPSAAWADVLVEEIARAKREKLEWDRFSSGLVQAPLDESSSVVHGLQISGEEQQRVEVPVTVRLARKWGDREVYELSGRLADGRIVKAYIIGQRGEGGPPRPYEPKFRAARALVDAVHTLASWPVVISLPEYILDEELIALLVERMGFDGGGGRAGTMTEKTMRELIVDPLRLAEEIDRYAERVSERSDEENAAIATSRFRAMSQRVREGANAEKGCGA
jgi:hypothetical protein